MGFRETRTLLAGVMLLAGCGSMLPAASQGRSSQNSAAAPFESSEPYHFAFASRQAWLDFVRSLPDGADASTAYATLFTEVDYDRYRNGTLVRATRITYHSDGLLIRGLMIAPRTPGPHPVILFNHGGIGKEGRIIVPEVLELHRLAERGYIVLASAYRGEGGSEGAPSMDGGDVDDVLALLRLVDRLPGADPTRMGMWGFSRGGTVTYSALARTDRLGAAVIVGGPTDLLTAPRRAEFDRFVYPGVIRNYAADKDGALARLSALRWPEKLAASTPILLLQGGNDPRVQASEAIRMALALQSLHHSYRLKVYEGGSHDLFENMADVRAEMDRWFDTYVRDKREAPANGIAALSKAEIDAE